MLFYSQNVWWPLGRTQTSSPSPGEPEQASCHACLASLLSPWEVSLGDFPHGHREPSELYVNLCSPIFIPSVLPFAASPLHCFPSWWVSFGSFPWLDLSPIPVSIGPNCKPCSSMPLYNLAPLRPWGLFMDGSWPIKKDLEDEKACLRSIPASPSAALPPLCSGGNSKRVLITNTLGVPVPQTGQGVLVKTPLSKQCHGTSGMAGRSMIKMYEITCLQIHY